MVGLAEQARLRRPVECPVHQLVPSRDRVSPPSRLERVRHALGVLVWIVAGATAAPGCLVKVYQPMSGLHEPVIVDPRLPNFDDAELDIHCVPGGDLNALQAGFLCRKVQSLFENQGALVRTHLQAGRSEDDALAAEPVDSASQGGAPRIGLTVELRARRVHTSMHPLSWAFCVASLTLVPGMMEETFAQDVVIRDASGFLLVTESLEGRIVRRFGAGTWVGNRIMDLWRDDADKVMGEAASRDLSDDLYRRLSQLAFDAKMHAQVLQQAPALRRGE